MSLPLATVATEFLDRPNLAKSTALSYEIALLPFLEKYGRIHINVLDHRIVYSYLKSQSHLSSSTLSRHKTILQSLFNFAIEQGYAETNPIGNARRPKRYSVEGETSSDRQRVITPLQFELLYRAIGNDCRLQVLTRLSHRSGASIRQLLSLNTQDVDLDRCQFTASCKNGHPRQYQYSDDVSQWLQKYLRFYRHSKSEALFTAQHPVTGNITRLSYRRVHQQWCVATKSNPKIESIRLQDLKHTYYSSK